LSPIPPPRSPTPRGYTHLARLGVRLVPTYTYGQQLAMDAAQARAAITNKLMEIANCGDARYELKALELLGKHSDIGIFTERSEITINYKDPADLEKEIKDRVKRLLNANVVETVPLSQSLDEELGVFEAEPTLAEELEDLLSVEDSEVEGEEDGGDELE
jgi:hypothetical protein